VNLLDLNRLNTELKKKNNDLEKNIRDLEGRITQQDENENKSILLEGIVAELTREN